MSDTPLLLCPFCGADLPRSFFGTSTHSFYIACRECEATTARYRSSESAIQAWNRRSDRDLAAAQEQLALAQKCNEAWHVGTMNDALFIINRLPRPSTDDVWHDRPDGPTLVMRFSGTQQQAEAIVKEHNKVVAVALAEHERGDKYQREFILKCERLGESEERAESAEAEAKRLREQLGRLIDDVENKSNDPHTLRHAKAALAAGGNKS